MRFLHPAAGYTLLDQKRSTGIGSEQEIFILTEIIESKKLAQTYFKNVNK
jgi:hypothetical protein